MYRYIQTDIHTYNICIYIHMYRRTYIHIKTHTHAYVHTYTYIHAYIHTCVRTYIHPCMQAYIHTHTFSIMCVGTATNLCCELHKCCRDGRCVMFCAILFIHTHQSTYRIHYSCSAFIGSFVRHSHIVCSLV